MLARCEASLDKARLLGDWECDEHDLDVVPPEELVQSAVLVGRVRVDADVTESEGGQGVCVGGGESAGRGGRARVDRPEGEQRRVRDERGQVRSRGEQTSTWSR